MTQRERLNVEAGMKDLGVKRGSKEIKDAVRRDQKDIKSSTDDTNKSLGEQVTSWKGIATAVAGVGAALGGLISLKQEDERSSDQLRVAIENLGTAEEGAFDRAQAMIAALERKTDFTDVEQRRSLALMIGITQDYELSLAALPRAMDIAEAKGQGLNESAAALSRTLTGQSTQLEALSLSYADAVKGGDDLKKTNENIAKSADESTRSLGASAAASGVAFAGTIGLLNDAFQITAGPGGLGFAVDFVELFDQVFGDGDAKEGAKESAEATESIAESVASIAESDGLSGLAASAGDAAEGLSLADRVLADIDARVGGFAASQKRPFDLLKTEAANFAESLGGILDPAFQSVSGRVVEILRPINDFMDANAPGLGTGLEGAITTSMDAVSTQHGPVFDQAVGALGDGNPLPALEQMLFGPLSPVGMLAGVPLDSEDPLSFIGDRIVGPGGPLTFEESMRAAGMDMSRRTVRPPPSPPGSPRDAGDGDLEVPNSALGSFSLGGNLGLPPGMLNGGNFEGLVETVGGSGGLRGELESRNEAIAEFQESLAKDSAETVKTLSKVPQAYGAALASLPDQLRGPFTEGAQVAETFTNDVAGSVNFITTQMGGGPVLGTFSSTLGSIASTVGAVTGLGQLATEAFGSKAVEAAIDPIFDFAGSIGSFFGFAQGVTNFQGGMAVVGEEGPELVTLPQGSTVIPHSRSAEVVRAAQAEQTVPGFAQGGGNETVSAVADLASIVSIFGGPIGSLVGIGLDVLNGLGVFGGGDDAWHEQFDSATDMVDTIFARRGVTAPNLPQLPASGDQQIFEAERGSVISAFEMLDFHNGGVPLSSGAGMLHRGDVVSTEPVLRDVVRGEISSAARRGALAPRYYGPMTVINGAQTLSAVQSREFSSVVN